MELEQMFSQKGKVAVITGGARGIGQASTLALAKAGADIAIIDLIDMSETVEQVESLGRKCKAYTADVTDEKQVNDTVHSIKKDFGQINVLFNNAGIALCRKCEEMTYEEWKRVIDIDLASMFLMSRAVGRVMIADGAGGSIVNTASMSGMIVNYPQEQVAYNAAKAGVIQLTRSLACEWAKHNIRVNSVSPGYICTDMTPPTTNKAWQEIWYNMSPMKRMGVAEEIAGGVLYLASPVASFTNGANLVIDGGYSCY